MCLVNSDCGLCFSERNHTESWRFRSLDKYCDRQPDTRERAGVQSPKEYYNLQVRELLAANYCGPARAPRPSA